MKELNIEEMASLRGGSTNFANIPAILAGNTATAFATSLQTNSNNAIGNAIGALNTAAQPPTFTQTATATAGTLTSTQGSPSVTSGSPIIS
jgi:hypothetical protein